MPFRISWGVYIRVAILAIATNIRILKRLISVVYYCCKSVAVLRSRFFSSSISSIKYHIKIKPYRYVGMIFLIIVYILGLVFTTSLNLSIKT